MFKNLSKTYLKGTKIGIITTRYFPSPTPKFMDMGGDISVSILAKEIADNGLKVDVLSFDALNEETEEIIDGIRIKRVGIKKIKNEFLRDIYILVYILNFFRDKNLIHSYTTDFLPLVMIAKFLTGKKTIITLNYYGYNYPHLIKSYRENLSSIRKAVRTLFHTIVRKMMSRMDKIISISEYLKKLYVDAGFPKEKIIVIPNMLSKSFIKKTDELKSPKASKKRYILFCGLLHKIKGIDVLIKAFAHIQHTKKDKNLILRIVGDGPEKKILEKLSKNLKVNQNIEFFGKANYNDMPSIYSSCQIYVHPAIWPEAFGRVIIEAMYCSLPVIATNIGGPSEIIPEKELLCPVKNYLELSKKIGDLLNNKIRIKKIGEKNKKYVKKYFPSKIINQIIKTYLDVVLLN